MQSTEQQQEHSLEQLVARIALTEQLHREELAARDMQIKLLTEQVRLLKAQTFGASSKQISPDQLRLMFNEAEALYADQALPN